MPITEYQYRCIGYYSESNEICSHYNNGDCMFFYEHNLTNHIKCPFEIPERLLKGE